MPQPIDLEVQLPAAVVLHTLGTYRSLLFLLCFLIGGQHLAYSGTWLCHFQGCMVLRISVPREVPPDVV